MKFGQKFTEIIAATHPSVSDQVRRACREKYKYSFPDACHLSAVPVLQDAEEVPQGHPGVQGDDREW
jgi:hypothetical protein